jgi:hypothetical protein
MNTEQAKQLADNALNALIEALEKGQSDTLKRYLATIGRFHNYSFGNCLMMLRRSRMLPTSRGSTRG